MIPPVHSVAYNVSKAGVLSLTRTLAYELAPFNVHINAINPGPVETPLAGRSFARRAGLMGITGEQYYDRCRADAPSRRLTSVEDVAAAVAFLASADSDGVVGVSLEVSGGLLVIPNSV